MLVLACCIRRWSFTKLWKALIFLHKCTLSATIFSGRLILLPKISHHCRRDKLWRQLPWSRSVDSNNDGTQEHPHSSHQPWNAQQLWFRHSFRPRHNREFLVIIRTAPIMPIEGVYSRGAFLYLTFSSMSLKREKVFIREESFSRGNTFLEKKHFYCTVNLLITWLITLRAICASANRWSAAR